MAVEVFGGVLAFAVDSFAEVLHDLGAGRFRGGEMRVYVVYEHG